MGLYIDETYADAYIGVNPFVKAKWALYDSTTKGEYIDYAEQQIDNLPWIGDKYSDTQPGAFPRDLSEIMDSDNYCFVNDLNSARYDLWNGAYPEDLQKAVCEFIIFLIRTQCYDDFRAQQEQHIGSWASGTLSVSSDVNQRVYTMPAERVRELLWFLTYPGFERVSTRLVGRA